MLSDLVELHGPALDLRLDEEPAARGDARVRDALATAGGLVLERDELELGPLQQGAEETLSAMERQGAKDGQDRGPASCRRPGPAGHEAQGSATGPVAQQRHANC